MCWRNRILTEVLITDLVPLRERGTWFGYQSDIWALGSVTGPIVGGSFTQHVTWRWIFWINLPICGIGLVAVAIFLRLNKRPGSISSKIPSFDWIGAFLLTASATSFLIAISWGGVMFAWASWRTLVPLILGAFGIVGFLCYEKFLAREPLIRLAIFKQRTANSDSELYRHIHPWDCTVVPGLLYPFLLSGCKGLYPHYYWHCRFSNNIHCRSCFCYRRGCRQHNWTIPMGDLGWLARDSAWHGNTLQSFTGHEYSRMGLSHPRTRCGLWYALLQPELCYPGVCRSSRRCIRRGYVYVHALLWAEHRRCYRRRHIPDSVQNQALCVSQPRW